MAVNGDVTTTTEHIATNNTFSVGVAGPGQTLLVPRYTECGV